jgi:hypothetical protein
LGKGRKAIGGQAIPDEKNDRQRFSVGHFHYHPFIRAEVDYSLSNIIEKKN